jgi:hypothetical protein
MLMLSITGFLRMIFYLIVIYIIVRFFTRLLMPVVMEDYVSKAKKQAERDRQEYLRQHKQKEGKISIDYVPPVDKKIKKDEGDYIDFEEVK